MIPVEQQKSAAVTARRAFAQLMVWPACVFSMLYHLEYGHDDFTMEARTYAGLLSCLAMICVVYAPKALPALGIGMAYFYMSLGRPVFGRALVGTLTGPVRIPHAAAEQAELGALLLGCAAAIAAIVVAPLSQPLARAIARKFPGRPVHDAQTTKTLRVLAGLSLLLRLIAQAGVSFGSMQQPVTVLANPAISVTLLFWDYHQTRRASSYVALWGLVGVLFLVGMFSGMLADALVPGVVAAGLIWAHSGQFPIRLFAAGLALLLLLNPVKHEYRRRAWYGSEELTPLVSARIWAEAFEATYTGQEDEAALAASLESTSSRVNVLGQVGQIFDWVPDRVPFAGPQKWLETPGLLIPRVLWPGKPIQEHFFNRDYTLTFRLQSPRTTGTSITVPIVGDGYWRLGWLGVILEGLVLGAIQGIAQGLSRVGSLANLLVASSMVIIRTDYHVFGNVNGVIQQAFVGVLLAWLADKLAGVAFTTPKTQPQRAARA